MKQGIIGSLLAVLFGFCLLPSVANTWTPQDFVRLVKTVEVKGEVAAPGIYEVAWDADVETILAAARRCWRGGRSFRYPSVADRSK